MKIAISYLHYAITAAGEYISRAAKRLGHEVKTIGPYFGTNMPYAGGMVVPDSYDHRPDIIVPDTRTVPIQFVEGMLGDWQPDIWLDVNAGFWLSGKPKNGIRATYLTDPHVIRWLYEGSAGQYDKVFCSQQHYKKPDEIYIPYGFDPEWHSPIDPPLDKEFVVTCIGNTYEPRVRLFTRLYNEGYSTYFKIGVAKEHAREIYNKSVMSVNWSSLLDMTARVFESMGLGVIPLLNRVPDLPLFFEENKHYLGFSNEDEAVEKVKWAFWNPEESKQIALNAREEVKDKHSWDNRVREMLTHLT